MHLLSSDANALTSRDCRVTASTVTTPEAGGSTECDLQAMVRQVIYRVGRNVLLFQQIEAGLKVLLPRMGPSPPTRASIRAAQSVVRKMTLGQTVEDLKVRASSSTEELEAYLGAVVASRNELVHHFYEHPDARLATRTECLSMLEHLDRQHEHAEVLHRFVTGAARQLAEHMLRKR
jgi:hypothetical protein